MAFFLILGRVGIDEQQKWKKACWVIVAIVIQDTCYKKSKEKKTAYTFFLV